MIRILHNSRNLAKFLTAVLMISTAAVYLSTLHPGFFPGKSTRWVTIALGRGHYTEKVRKVSVEQSTAPLRIPSGARVSSSGLLDDWLASHEVLRESVMEFRSRYQIWSLLSNAVARIPLGSLWFRMNALSAIFGAIGVGLLFSLIRSVFLLLTFHSSPLTARQKKLGAGLAAITAAIALATAPAYWIASTRCLPNSFETTLIILTGFLIFKAIIKHCEWPLLLVGVLQGILLLELENSIFLIPIIYMLSYRAMKVGDLHYGSANINLLIGFIVGIVVYLCIYSFVPVGSTGSFMTPLSETTRHMMQQWRMLSGGWMGNTLWLISICFIVLPFISAICMSIWGDPYQASASTTLMLMTLMGTTTIALTSSNLAPWGLLRDSPSQELPTTLALLTAIICGFLVGHGFLLTRGRLLAHASADRYRQQGGHAAADASFGRLIVGYVILVLLGISLFNFRQIVDWSDPMPGRVAAAVVRNLKDQRWIISDSPIDDMLKIHAFTARKKLRVLKSSHPPTPRDRRAQSIMLRDPAFADITQEQLDKHYHSASNTLVEAILGTSPASQDLVWIIGQPELWKQSGRIAVPDLIGYRGATPDTELDWQDIYTHHTDFWDSIDAFPALGVHAPSWLRGQRSELRRLMADVCESLANSLAQAGKISETKDVMRRALIIKDDPLPSDEDIFY